MNPLEMAATKAEFESFVEDVFASLPRADQRSKGSLYLRGLMLDGRRKSMQPMGARLVLRVVDSFTLGWLAKLGHVSCSSVGVA